MMGTMRVRKSRPGRHVALLASAAAVAAALVTAPVGAAHISMTSKAFGEPWGVWL